MKNLLYVSLFLIVFLVFSSSAIAQKKKNIVKQQSSKTASPKFIEGIETDPSERTVLANSENEEIPAKRGQQVSNIGLSTPTKIEGSTALQFKYAQLLNCNVEMIKNLSLYNFIDEWWETRYRYGGTTKAGIDCSAFTSVLMSAVFGKKLSRTAKDQYNETTKVDKNEMQEGDLLFFNTRGGISHVALYLGENYFVHASTNVGVTISSLEDPYYSDRFVSGGRVVSDLAKKTAGK